MNKPKLLWVDLTVKQDRDAECYFSDVCHERLRNGCIGITKQDCNLSGLCNRFRHTGVEAVAEAVSEAMPQLLCLDYDYPNVKRLRMLPEIKHRFPSIPILMLTVHHSEALAVWAFRAGVRDFIVKPINGEELLRRVSVFLRFPSEPGESHGKLMPLEPIPMEARFTERPAAQKSTYPVLSYLESHLHREISLNDAAGLCRMERFQFCRTFKKEQGIGFREYLVRRRIDKAEELLNNPHALVSDVAFTVGFNDVAHFSRMFRRYKGTAPAAYRQMLSTRQPLGRGTSPLTHLQPV
jgi:YesN/AraC family two-component response regulator